MKPHKRDTKRKERKKEKQHYPRAIGNALIPYAVMKNELGSGPFITAYSEALTKL